MSNLSRLSPGVYRDKNGKVVRLPTSTRVISNRRDKKTKNGRRSDSRKTVRGKEFTIRRASPEATIIYGRMKTGGAATFVNTSNESLASLTVGTGNSQICFIAKTPGIAGNDIRIEVIVPVDQGSIVINTGPNAIQIVNKSSGSSPTGTSNQIIAAIRADSTANSMVTVHNGEGDGTGVVSAFDSTFLAEGGGTWLYQVITLACHEIEAVEKVFLDGREVTFGASPDARWGTGAFAHRVFMAVNYGSDSQPAQADLMAQLPALWTTDHRQRGHAHVVLILVWDANLFPQGLPEITFQVKGKKVYDPRSGLTTWSQNAALIIADYLMDTRYGLGIPSGDIDMTTLGSAADTCDEAVSLNGGGTEPRYTINGHFDTSMSPQEVLEEMAAAIGGDIVYQGGKWYVHAGRWRSPALSLTIDDLRGPISIVTKIPRRDLFNCVRGQYVNPNADYVETDFPLVKNDTYITQDGKRLYEDIDLNFVTSSATAQRLSKIELERIRQGITIDWPGKLPMLQLRVSDTVNVTLAKYGWSNKTFEVRDIQFSVDAEGEIGVDLVLRETASGVFDWASGEETTVDLSPDTNLPDPFTVAAPTGLTLASGTTELYVRGDGTIASRLKVSWTEPGDEFVTVGGHYEIQFKRHDASDWSQSYSVPGGNTFQHIYDVEDAIAYDVQIRSVNSLNAASSWVQSLNYTVIGKTEPPSDVTVFSASVAPFGILISWTQIADLDADQYELREGSSWGSATLIAQVRGSQYASDFRMAGTYHLLIKAVDTSGNYSVNAASYSIVVNSPTAPPSPSHTIVGPDCQLSWLEASGDFAIQEYEVRYGASFGAGQLVATSRTLNLTIPVNWGSTRTFWIAARDVAGNLGTATSRAVTITNPSSVMDFGASVVDNNVLLDWTEPSVTTLPVQKYDVYKGDDFGSAVLLGTVFGTFHTYVENGGGTFTYWLVTIDTAGNRSSEVSTTAVVTAPNDFFIRDDTYPLMADATSSNVVVINSDPLVIRACVDGSETWGDWWDNNSWTTWQDAIDDSPEYLQPTETTGYIQFQLDYGVLLSPSFVDFSWVALNIDAGVVITPKISASDDGSSWTDYAGVSQAFTDAFQYVRCRLDFSAVSNLDLVEISQMRIRVSLRLSEETGSITCNSGDSGGTTVTLTLDWLDVSEIGTQVQGTTAAFSVVDFTDIPNPTSFKILVFDTDGNRVTRDVFYRVKGAVQ